MTCERISELLRKGEGLTIEFKRCSGKIEHDVFRIEVSLKAVRVAQGRHGKNRRYYGRNWRDYGRNTWNYGENYEESPWNYEANYEESLRDYEENY